MSEALILWSLFRLRSKARFAVSFWFEILRTLDRKTRRASS